MADTHHAQGPGKSVLGIGQRIVSIMVEMVETRLRLAVVELEEITEVAEEEILKRKDTKQNKI